MVAMVRKKSPNGPTFLLVILPDSAPTIISAVKGWGDCDVGVPTQCVVCIVLNPVAEVLT